MSESRSIAALVGLAIGDALGSPVEFRARDSFPPIIDMIGGGPFNLKAGQWTDDTSMALAMTDALIEAKRFDAHLIMENFYQWYKHGVYSSKDYCFDIGITTSNAIKKYEESLNPFAGNTNEMNAGNGSIMRLAPIPIYYQESLTDLVNFSVLSSMLTHSTTEVLDAVAYFSMLIYAAIRGYDKDYILENYTPDTILDYGYEITHGPILDIINGRYKNKKRNRIQSSTYVLHTLEAALWAFYHSSTFEEGALLCVNLGDDSDTVTSVYGQIAGPYYDLDGIPQKWKNCLHEFEYIFNQGNRLYQNRFQPESIE